MSTLRLGLLTAFVATHVQGTMFMGEIRTGYTWLGNLKSFFDGFSAREQQAYFYPREYLNDGLVTFMVMDGPDYPEVEKLRQLCAGAPERSDFIVHDLFRNSSEYRVYDLYQANFLFLPTYAGIVLDGQCKEGAEETLRSYLHKMYLHEMFHKAHGHTMITYSSTEAFNNRMVDRTTKIAKERFRYDLTSFQKAMTDKNGIPEEFTDYMMSQTILIDRFYRPTLQYCQLFAPLILQNPSTLERTSGAPSTVYADLVVPTLQEWRASRPIDVLMVDRLIVDHPKYKARQEAFSKLPSEFPGVYKVIKTKDEERPSFILSDCDPEAPMSSQCALVVDDAITAKNQTLELRKELLAKTKFVVVTRGEFPHEEIFYQAVEAGAIIVNTIDKSLDMAMPFQCQVPWEEFSIRIGSEEFLRDPARSLRTALDAVDDAALLKMIKVSRYFSPNVLMTPGYAQSSHWVENVLLNAVRRCTLEQLVAKFGFTGLNTQCPFTDWAKTNLVMRTVFNVDTPPWFEL